MTPVISFHSLPSCLYTAQKQQPKLYMQMYPCVCARACACVCLQMLNLPSQKKPSSFRRRVVQVGWFC